MLVSLKAVKKYVDLSDLSSEEIAHGLTFAGGEVEEDGTDFVEELTAVLEGEDGVLEGGLFWIVYDGVDFGFLSFDAFAECWHVVFGFDAAEVGDFIRSAPFGKEGIVVHGFLFFTAGKQQGGCCGND